MGSADLNALFVVKGWIGRLALVAIGLVFLVAGGLKALDPAGFIEQIGNYNVLPAALAPAAAYVIIPLEIALGAALLLDFRRRWSLGAAFIMLAGFVGLMAWTWATGGDVSSCGCFGNFVERTPAQTLIEDLLFIVVAALGFLAPVRAGTGDGARGAAVAGTAVVAGIFMTLAPGLPLDGLVTALKPGVGLADLKLSLPDPSLSQGRWLIAVLDLKQEESGRAADALNVLGASPGAPSIAAIHADEDDVKDSFFWAHGPTFPMYRVVHGEMRRLYRRLPRYFLLEDGKITAVWNALPAAETLLARGGASDQERTR